MLKSSTFGSIVGTVHPFALRPGWGSELNLLTGGSRLAIMRETFLIARQAARLNWEAIGKWDQELIIDPVVDPKYKDQEPSEPKIFEDIFGKVFYLNTLETPFRFREQFITMLNSVPSGVRKRLDWYSIGPGDFIREENFLLQR